MISDNWNDFFWFGPSLGTDKLRVLSDGKPVSQAMYVVAGETVFVHPSIPADTVQLQRVVVPLTHKTRTHPPENPVK